MIESADLPRLLRRIRRRTRTLAALEGAVLGGAIGAGVLAGALAIARVLAGGSSRGRLGAAAAGAIAAALIGAAVAGARRISLQRCARLADAALDRGGTPRDRVLSALAFLEGPDTPLTRAAVADAVSRARGLAPALAAPARRPRQLPGLVGAALALMLVGAWPAPAPGARNPVPGAAPAQTREAGLRIAPRALDAERAEARAAASAAEAEGDVRLGKLAAELHATLEALTNGQLPAGEALDRLEDLARRAREAGEQAEEARAALRATAKALEPTSETRSLGRALGADEPEATARALSDLAARTENGAANTNKTNENVARALDAAAAALAGVGATGGESADGAAEQPRRLARDAPPAATGATGSSDGTRRASGERQLERLRRNLNDTASACRANPEACARRLRERAEELKRLQRDARGSEARRQLESAARQARERLRRGDLERRPGGEEQRFQRAARGQPGEGGGREGEAGEPQGSEAVEAEGGDDTFAEQAGGGEQTETQAGGEGASKSAPGGDESGAAAQGQGAGHEPGGEPLGAGSAPPTHGREREARVRDGAGPTRSEVIESAARRGFATRDYVRVFSDYQPVVEESLATAAVPEGRRYVVRRYFQLIRPRAARPSGAP